MTNRRGFVFRILADLLFSGLAVLAFVGASHSTNGMGLIVAFGAVFLAAAVAAWMEPSAKRVFIHPVLIMLPELIALPAAALTCHGFECGGIIAFLILAGLFTFILVGVSFATFYLKRWFLRT